MNLQTAINLQRCQQQQLPAVGQTAWCVGFATAQQSLDQITTSIDATVALLVDMYMDM